MPPTHSSAVFLFKIFKMFYPSSTIFFVQGVPLRLPGRFRSVELLGCSRRLPRSMPFLSANFKSCMSHIQHYPDVKEMHALTVDDYHVLIGAGRLDDKRVELLNGFLITKHPQSVEHVYITHILTRIFSRALENENRAVVRDSKPITLEKSNSEPEPDIVIASGVSVDYSTRHPSPRDILLIVEVSKSTIVKDSTIKLENYASEGIPEYWIVDVEKRKVQVFRKPQENSYESKETFSSGFIAPAAFSDVHIRVEDVFHSRGSKELSNPVGHV